MKIYGHPLSSCTRKILVTLAEKGQRAELTTVDLFTGEHKSPAHLERHPFGVVPVLEDEGFALYESRAILRYLDARFPAPPLTPSTMRERAAMDQWLSVDQSYVGPYTRELAVQRILMPHQGRATDEAKVEAARAELSKAFAVYDKTLASRAFLTGETFSLADISLAPYIASLASLRADDLLASRPHLTSWWHRVSERPSWNAALATA